MEIERKFLVKSIPVLTGLVPIYFRQGYLKITDPEVRIREKIISNKKIYVRTIKYGEGLCRTKTETEISAEEFKRDWPLTKGHRVEKNYYEIPYNELKLKGLYMIEVEFSSVEQAKGFVPLEWFGRDVTNSVKYENKNLAC